MVSACRGDHGGAGSLPPGRARLPEPAGKLFRRGSRTPRRLDASGPRAGTAAGPIPRPRLIDPDAGAAHLLDSAERVLAVLAEQVSLVRTTDADPLAKARVIGYLAGLGLRAVELVDHETRIAELEARLADRAEERTA